MYKYRSVLMEQHLEIESMIMEALWNSDHALNRNEILEIINGQINESPYSLGDLAYFLKKLVRNQYVQAKNINNVYHYVPLYDKTGYNREKINKKLNQAFGMNFEELLLLYMDQEKIQANIDSINNFINNLKQ